MSIKYRTEPNGHEGTWTCFLCGKEYPNTLIFCPVDNIARKHSNNLHITAEKKKKKKLKKEKLLYNTNH